jgi:transcriptional regulator with XRE-family HTH domain
MEIHEKVKKIREDKRFSQTEVAERLNITNQSYWAIEKGKTELTIKRLFELAAILSVSPLELLGLELPESNESKKVKELEKENESLKEEKKQIGVYLSTTMKMLKAFEPFFEALALDQQQSKMGIQKPKMTDEEYQELIKSDPDFAKYIEFEP